MLLLTPNSTRAYTLFPYATLFGSSDAMGGNVKGAGSHRRPAPVHRNKDPGGQPAATSGATGFLGEADEDARWNPVTGRAAGAEVPAGSRFGFDDRRANASPVSSLKRSRRARDSLLLIVPTAHSQISAASS